MTNRLAEEILDTFLRARREDADAADAKETIRAAVRYLLESAAGSDRGDIGREIIELVSEVARSLAPVAQDPFDDKLPGG